MSHQFGSPHHFIAPRQFGIVAVTTGPLGVPPAVDRAVEAFTGERLRPCNGVPFAAWGAVAAEPRAGAPVLLTSTVIGERGQVEPVDIGRLLYCGDTATLARMLPPFGVVGVTRSGLRFAGDDLAFCPLYRVDADGWAAVSTSPLLLARMSGAGLDAEAFLLQSQLGWQLGERTLFDGVRAVPPGISLHLDARAVRAEPVAASTPRPGSITLDDGVAEAADALRGLLARYLDQTAEPTLQLTGGQDSRIVLSAVPRARRAGLNAMTLDVPGTHDARIAADLSARYGMRHQVRGLDGIEEVTPEDWFARATSIAGAQGCMTDPVARAVTAFAEESFEQGPRLSGLGGELARGFYYHGRIVPSPITRRRTETLAAWRMLANDAVEPAALASAHRERAFDTAVDAVHKELLASGDEWFAATDALYEQRVRRWGGPGETSVSFRRSLTNPMLSHRFVAVARGLSPRAKAGGRFLGRLQIELDADLADVPLDDRPPPRAYGRGGPEAAARIAAARLGLLTRKVAQRARRKHRPPPGGAVIASGLTRFLRHEPALLDPVRATGLFDERYLAGLTQGLVSPTPGTLALLINVLVAVDPGAGPRP